MPLDLLGSLTGGLNQVPTGSPTSGLSDSGQTSVPSTNVVGNFNANLGEIVKNLNSGSSFNGGRPFILSSPVGNMNALQNSSRVNPVGNNFLLIGAGIVVAIAIASKRL